VVYFVTTLTAQLSLFREREREGGRERERERVRERTHQCEQISNKKK
jgi:hypothetical protein